MRESMGGTLLFWIVLIFLSIFITFMASVIKYAFTYKIKNNLIDYIERNEGIRNKEELETKLAEFGYPRQSNYMVCKHKVGENDDTSKVFWFVKLNATFKMPVINSSFNIPIQGETVFIQTGVLNTDSSWGVEAGSNCECRGKATECIR